MTAAGDERGAVQRELVIGERGETRRIPERCFASPLRGRCGLAHADGLRTDGKDQKQCAGVERLLGGKMERWNDGQTGKAQDRGLPPRSILPSFRHSLRRASPHR